jgi:hypothetical protein
VNCGSCRFAALHRPEGQAFVPGAETATCHRYPPAGGPVIVDVNWWCGEYQPKPAAAPPIPAGESERVVRW